MVGEKARKRWLVSGYSVLVSLCAVQLCSLRISCSSGFRKKYGLVALAQVIEHAASIDSPQSAGDVRPVMLNAGLRQCLVRQACLSIEGSRCQNQLIRPVTLPVFCFDGGVRQASE